MEVTDFFEERIKINIGSYTVRNLYAEGELKEYFTVIAEEFNVGILITDKQGRKEISIGNFGDSIPERDPDLEICVGDIILGYIYLCYDLVRQDQKATVEHMVAVLVKVIDALGMKAYMHRETEAYAKELEKKLENRYHGRSEMKEDVLTGVFSKNYLEGRMQVLDRAEVAPVAVINANINDYNFVCETYGVEEGDSLIQLIATILMKEAKPEYLIGRVGGDNFLVLIPLAEDGEAEGYAERVQRMCLEYEDTILTPSVAIGIAYKINVEQTLQERISDAEYEMFQNKLEIKGMPGYAERMQKGLENNRNINFIK